MAKQTAKGRKTPVKATKSPVAGEKPAESPALLVDPIPPEVREPAKAAPTTKVPPTPAAKPAEPKQTAPAKPPEPAVTTAKAPEKPAPKPAEPAKAPPPPPARQGGFIPLVVGGLIAGVIGFGVATLTTPASDGPLADQVTRQAATIASLEQQIATLASAEAPTADLGAIETAQADLAAEVERLDAAIAALNDRFDTMPTVAATDGTSLPAPDLAAYQAEIDALRAQMQEQMSAMTETAMSQLEGARAEAAAIEENAAAAARQAAARAALARVQTGLESGAPLGAALDDLQEATGEPLPDALAAVRDGVPTLASLQESFPDAARAALATARSEGVAGEETSGLGAFLRNQLDVRSVAPREGDDVDAILSRAEAAVKTGRLSDALAELAALPEVARAEMSDWLAQAEARASAVTAVDMLATSFNDN